LGGTFGRRVARVPGVHPLGVAGQEEAVMQKLAKRRDEKGMTTAEYAVGTVATVSIVGVLLSIINNPEFRAFLSNLVEALLNLIIRMITGG
jgi:hypothetical protein